MATVFLLVLTYFLCIEPREEHQKKPTHNHQQTQNLSRGNIQQRRIKIGGSSRYGFYSVANIDVRLSEIFNNKSECSVSDGVD